MDSQINCLFVVVVFACFLFCCLCSRISLVPKVQGYVKRNCPDQMCICAGWLAPLLSRYIDSISLGQVFRLINLLSLVFYTYVL